VIEYQQGALQCWRVTFEGGGHYEDLPPGALIGPFQFIQGTTFDVTVPTTETSNLDGSIKTIQIANNPSGSLVAFWRDPGSMTTLGIGFVQPMSLVRGSYASEHDIVIEPFSDHSEAFTYPANAPASGNLREWDLFQFDRGANVILAVLISAPYSHEWIFQGAAIDDFEACRLTSLTVQIDIKPSSHPNCFNNDGSGVIPVAILGSAEFDVTQVDPASVQLEGMAVRAVGKADKLQAHIEDVNADGFDDLVLQIEDTDGTFASGSGTATLSGQLLDGTPIQGSDSICVSQ
jgi:hypothetical protein